VYNGSQWEDKKHSTTPNLELIILILRLLSLIRRVFIVIVSAEFAVEEKVISSISPPRLPVSAVQNAGKSSATGTCEG